MMSKRPVILTPDHLLAAVSAALKRVPAMPGVDTKRALILPASDGAAAAQADIVIAPELPGILRWAWLRYRHWPTICEVASRQLTRLAETAARSDVSVVEEQDLTARPSRLWYGLANAARLARRGRPATGSRLIGRHKGSFPHGFETTFLHMYADLPVRRGAIAWCPSFRFFSHDGLCMDPIDITGRARALCLGPYLVLPRGTWRADLSFALSEEAAGYDYLIRFGTKGDFIDLPYRPKSAGAQSATLHYEVREDKPVELRIYLRRAAFHGVLNLAGAALTKIGEPRHGASLPPAPPELSRRVRARPPLGLSARRKELLP